MLVRDPAVSLTVPNMIETAAAFPGEAELTHILVVSDPERSRDFYRDVVGAHIVREYGGTSVVARLAGTWLLLVTGGAPTPDKPTITFTPPVDANAVTHAMTFRVPNCQAAYELLRSRGAVFLTPPIRNDHEVRCFFRDPDGHLIELSEYSG